MTLFATVFHYNMLLRLSPVQELVINVCWYMFLIAIVLGIIFYYVSKKDRKKKDVENVSRAIDEKLSDDYENIGTVEKAIARLIAENQDDPELSFFLNALLQNYRNQANKLLLIKRTEVSGYVSYNLEAIATADQKAIEALHNAPPAVYTNFATMVDNETLALYGRLSHYYASMHLPYNYPIEKEFNVDWGNGYFYYVKVDDYKIPYFVSDKKEYIYMYPTSIIVLRENAEFDLVPLANVKPLLKVVENAQPKVALISIQDLNLEFLTTHVDNAIKFYDTFVALQNHLKEKETLENSEASGGPSSQAMDLILDEVQQLVGLETVKNDFLTIANYIKIQQMRQQNGLKVQSSSHHCVFTGNPGTGKTTIARMLAKVYKELGVVKSGHLVEVDRSKLVGEYVGQTAVKTNNVIDEALDGILFIDEAYSSVQGGNTDFGAEAISTLLKRMEDDRDRLVVVLAGYGNEMKEFIDSNPGLQSRFTRYLHFDDYTAEELFKIFYNLVITNDYVLTPDAADLLLQELTHAVDQKNKNFGNARFVRNFFEKACEIQATRLSKLSSISEHQLRTIEATDIPKS